MAKLAFSALAAVLLLASGPSGNCQGFRHNLDIHNLVDRLALIEDEAGRSYETFTENRPRISPRELSADERRSISRLVKAYVAKKGVGSVYSDIEPLIQLATSGDKSAILGLLTALATGGVPNDRYGTIDRLPRGPAFDDRVNLRESLIQALLADWGAHYWSRHGPHRFAAMVMKPCLSSELTRWISCHFNVYEWPNKALTDYAQGGGKKPEFNVIIHSNQSNAAWFEWRLTQDIYFLNIAEYSRFKRYAHVNGELPRVVEMIRRMDYVERQRQDPAYKAREAALEAQRYAQYRRDMQALAEREANTPEARRRAQSSREFQQILNNAPSPHAANNANNSQSVTVRNYDKNGNYIGSTTTTRTDAELLGAKPQ